MDKLQEVPVNTITGKDLDYLSDMFQWNYCAFKKSCNEFCRSGWPISRVNVGNTT